MSFGIASTCLLHNTPPGCLLLKPYHNSRCVWHAHSSAGSCSDCSCCRQHHRNCRIIRCLCGSHGGGGGRQQRRRRCCLHSNSQYGPWTKPIDELLSRQSTVKSNTIVQHGQTYELCASCCSGGRQRHSRYRCSCHSNRCGAPCVAVSSLASKTVKCVVAAALGIGMTTVQGAPHRHLPVRRRPPQDPPCMW